MALNLNKLFVRVPSTASATTDQIKTLSQQTGNDKKVYFVEATNEIVVKGVVYGVDPSTVEKISDLQALIGAEKITDPAALSQTIIGRLEKLEAIKIATASEPYLSLTLDSSVPTIGVKTIPIENASNGSTGLLDAAAAKGYIDAEIAKATTEVVEGKGIDVTETTHTDGHAIYTIDSSLTLQYNEASGNNAATITLTGANGGVFGTVNVSDIIGNGVISDTEYYPSTGELVLTFNKADGTTQDVSIDLTDILDLGDLMVKADSTDYLEITQVTPGSATDENQLSFAIKTVDVSTASASATGLADAFKVKEYVDSKTTDLAITAAGDNYVSATVDAATDKKHVIVDSNVTTLTATAGSAGTYDAEGAQTAAPTAGTLSGTANSLADAADIATKVKTYVDGAMAIEVARSNANTLASIKALDANVSTKGTNVSVGVTEVDGVITAVNVTEDYATVDSSLGVTTNTGLVKGSDIEKVKTYVDTVAQDLSIGITGDNYITATRGDNKNYTITADVVDLTLTTGGNEDSTLAGTADSLVDAADAASKVSQFVNARIGEEVAKLDSTTTATDTYFTMTVGEADGKLIDASTSATLTYGTMNGTDPTATTTNGIAKAEDVQTFVDTYDFWDEYTGA